MNLFEIATKEAWRFSNKNGREFTVEDLWRASEATIDDVYNTLQEQLAASATKSLTKRSTADTSIQNKIDLIDYVWNAREKDKEAKKTDAQNAVVKARLKELIAKKREDSMLELSIEDLEKQLAAL